MASIAQDAITAVPLAPAVPRRRSNRAPIVVEVVTLIAVLVSSISLFVRGWVHVSIVFKSPGRAANLLLQTFGVDVDKEIARIADQEISKSIPPTLWEYKGHYFQIIFALLMVIAAVMLVALIAPRLRIVAHAAALLAGAGIVSVIVVVVLRATDESSALPARVGKMILNSRIANRVINLTTGKPEIAASVGWPLIAGVAGLIVVVIGVLLGFIFAVSRAHAHANAG